MIFSVEVIDVSPAVKLANFHEVAKHKFFFKKIIY